MLTVERIKQDILLAFLTFFKNLPPHPFFLFSVNDNLVIHFLTVNVLATFEKKARRDTIKNKAKPL